VAQPTDPDETEVGPGPSSSSHAASEASAADYTEYVASGDSSATITGFDKAKTLARQAQAESGRLLKKRFVLEEVLGRGGMGVVYKARDLRKVEAEDSNPYIAAKVLGQNFKEHPQAFVSLQQEAVKSQKLAHPNIVTVHDFDREGNTIFMTMELLKGDPLDTLLKLEAPFSKETAFRYFLELCAGLEYAHKRELIHSDFKPANIFVTTGGTVKILDFGIARAASRDSQSSDFDAGDLGALTPAYATVEMVNREAPSFSDDVYALACVLFQMLTGHHPYERGSAAEALERKLKPKRPSMLSSKEWQALSLGLNPNKSKRPATVAEFRSAMIPEKRSPVVKIVAGVSLVLAAGGVWLGLQQANNDGNQAVVIENKLQAAKECFYAQSYECAIENAKVVTSLDSTNREARDLLQAAGEAQLETTRLEDIEGLLEDSRRCLIAGDYACVKVKAGEVLQIEPGEARALALLEQVELESRRQDIGAVVNRAEACLDKADMECAQEALQQAKLMGADSADLKEVSNRADTMARVQMEQSQQKEQAINRELAEARSCYQNGRFDCAAAAADAVLAMDGANASAIEMQQSIKLARAQRLANEKTVGNFLRQAQACYEKKNYSCAIAMSDSALAIIPDYGPARTMKSKAKNSQDRVKKSISIE
jgi:tetratricopeptide (TPR) repeat protein